jgi:uncharacterized protein
MLSWRSLFPKPAFKAVSKFQALSAYQRPLSNGYGLLPFRFTSLDNEEYVLTNQAGEYFVVDKQTLHELVHRRLSPVGQIYGDLKSKHFLVDDDSSIAFGVASTQSANKIKATRRFYRTSYIRRLASM